MEYIRGGKQKSFYTDDEKEFVPCPFCGSNEQYPIDEESGLGIVRCKKCHLIYVSPRVKASYENYWGDKQTYYNEARLIFEGKKPHHRDRNYDAEIKFIRRFKPEGRWLDVGTNMGFFLRKVVKAGYAAEGVEPSPALSSLAKEQFGLNVHQCLFEEAELPPNSYDIITMIDVFEHIPNPSLVLEKAHRLLKQDGILVIKVPNGNYNLLKMKIRKTLGLRASLHTWNAYEHVIHYTVTTFKNMAKKHGFRVVEKHVPLPIHPPVWAQHVGHYYQYPSPFVLDWKKRIARNFLYLVGKIELFLLGRTAFSPDLMFVLKKYSS